MPLTPPRITTKLLSLYPGELVRITARARTYGLLQPRDGPGRIPTARQYAATDNVLSPMARIARWLDELARLADANRTLLSPNGLVPSWTGNGRFSGRSCRTAGAAQEHRTR